MKKIHGTVTLNFEILTDVDVTTNNMEEEESDKFISGIVNGFLIEGFWVDEDVFVKRIEEV